MKLLLDENLPHQMRLELVGHDVFTVAHLGWSGIENGELLKRAAAEGFDALISNDRGLQYQHDLDNLPIAVVVVLVPKNTIEAIRPIYPALSATLSGLQPKTFVTVSIP